MKSALSNVASLENIYGENEKSVWAVRDRNAEVAREAVRLIHNFTQLVNILNMIETQ